MNDALIDAMNYAAEETVKHAIDLQPFLTPNFANVKQPPGKREDGVRFTTSIPLAELSSSTLAAMCDEFRREVFKKAGKTEPKP